MSKHGPLGFHQGGGLSLWLPFNPLYLFSRFLPGGLGREPPPDIFSTGATCPSACHFWGAIFTYFWATTLWGPIQGNPLGGGTLGVPCGPTWGGTFLCFSPLALFYKPPQCFGGHTHKKGFSFLAPFAPRFIFAQQRAFFTFGTPPRGGPLHSTVFHHRGGLVCPTPNT